jgi:hypothetical protein
MIRLKANFFLFQIALNWLSLIAIMSLLMIVSALYDRKTTPKVSWSKSIALAQDLMVNAIMGGSHRTYISSLLRYLKLTGSRGGTHAANFVDWLWLKIYKEENHCVEAMKPDDVYDFSARRAIAGTLVYWLSLGLFGYLVYLGVTSL